MSIGKRFISAADRSMMAADGSRRKCSIVLVLSE